MAKIDLLVLFLDAIYLPTRPSGAQEGVLVAGGYTRTSVGQLSSREVLRTCW